MDTIKIRKNDRVKMVAHRGVSGLEIENSAAAFLAAGNRSYYGVETDIRKTRDGFYVCSHDADTHRTCEIIADVEKTDFSRLRQLNLHDVDGRTDRGELIICSAQEYRKICRKYDKVCVTELKRNFSREELEDIVEIFGGHDGVCWISFFFDPLARLREMNPDAHCQFLVSSWADNIPERLSEAGMGLDIEQSALTRERIAACHARGVEVNAWTVDDPKRAEELISWDIDYITSNILE